jgi:tetratricopeptide (TPR) repeat protein
LPAVIPQGDSADAFNRWANAAAILHALGRGSEAFEATKRALAIFPDSAFVHFLRGNLLEEASNFSEAEREYQRNNLVEVWGRSITGKTS